jgi:hypothetical protein
MDIRLMTNGAAGALSNGAELVQICFVVENLNDAMASFSRLLGAGPWFRSTWMSAEQDRTTLHGKASPLNAGIALAYAGGTMYELVEPAPGSRSIFSEWVEKFGFGLHHFGFATTEFDHVAGQLAAEGNKVVMTSVTPRGARVLMVESRTPVNALHELIEVTPESRAFYRRMREAAEAWDGVTLEAG